MLQLRKFFTEEDGMGTVEIILIIVVLISLVLLFKKSITSTVNEVLKKITKSAKDVIN